jgi:phospholipid/cholesterol/gamma-HCH transport system permease protein
MAGLSAQLKRPLNPIGGFIAMSLDTARVVTKRPFQLREYLQQVIFLIRVTIAPAIFLTIPFLGVTIFLLNELLIQIGAIDLAGAGTGLATISNIGPIASVLVLAGAGSTAICADLGARTIREEIDAMTVLGVDPVHRLVLPRVLAATTVALFLNALVDVFGIASGYLMSVVVQGASAGQFVANLTLLTSNADFVLGNVKALIFGVAAGLVACYRGLTAGGGAKGVGDAVNQTVVLVVVLLFALNIIITAVDLQLRSGK